MSNARQLEQCTDEQLVAQFTRGDQQSFEELIGRYAPKAFSLANRLTKNPQDAEEVLQDVFTTVYTKIKGFEGKSTFSSWLYRVTVNASLMKLRKRRQNRCIPSEDSMPEVERSIMLKSMDSNEADLHAGRNQIARALESAITKLPDEYRPVYILRDVDGLSSGEVSKILQLSVPAIKSRLHRARMMLRRRLAPFYRELYAPVSRRSVGNL